MNDLDEIKQKLEKESDVNFEIMIKKYPDKKELLLLIKEYRLQEQFTRFGIK